MDGRRKGMNKMTVTIEGEVVKTGRPKSYGGGHWNSKPSLKFFIEVVDDEGQHYKTMVSVRGRDKREREAWAYDGVGDRVRYTVQRTKDEDDEGALWTTGCTFKRDFERLSKDGEEHYREVKAKERKAEEEAKKEEEARKVKMNEEIKETRKQLKADYLEAQSNDPRIPEDVAGKISATFDIDQIVDLLQDTTLHGPIPHGTGGKKDWSGKGDWSVGSGLRRPYGALYDMPKSWRESALSKAVDTGIIVKVEGGYESTEKGMRLLAKLARCPECDEVKTPFLHISTYRQGKFNTKSMAMHLLCPEHDDTDGYGIEGMSSSVAHEVMKDWPKRMKEIIEEVGDVEVPEYISEFEHELSTFMDRIREKHGFGDNENRKPARSGTETVQEDDETDKEVDDASEDDNQYIKTYKAFDGASEGTLERFMDGAVKCFKEEEDEDKKEDYRIIARAGYHAFKDTHGKEPEVDGIEDVIKGWNDE